MLPPKPVLASIHALGLAFDLEPDVLGHRGAERELKKACALDPSLPRYSERYYTSVAYQNWLRMIVKDGMEPLFNYGLHKLTQQNYVRLKELLNGNEYLAVNKIQFHSYVCAAVIKWIQGMLKAWELAGPTRHLEPLRQEMRLAGMRMKALRKMENVHRWDPAYSGRVS